MSFPHCLTNRKKYISYWDAKFYQSEERFLIVKLHIFTQKAQAVLFSG